MWQDWARTHSSDKYVDAALMEGGDPGISLVSFSDLSQRQAVEQI